MNIREFPVSERPREKMVAIGRNQLSNQELLAILIGSGSGEKTALHLATEVLTLEEGGLSSLQNITMEELLSVKGIGLAKATQILAAIELGQRSATLKGVSLHYITGTTQVADLLVKEMRYYQKEHFVVLMINTKGGVLGKETVSVGDLSSSIVHPRETFSQALKRGAYGVIFAHNHPSGDPTPSKEDLEVTRRLCEAGDILGIKVVDHIIIGDGKYISFKEEGYM